MGIRHIVIEVEKRCVVSYVSYYVVDLWSVGSTGDAGVVHLVDVARLVDWQ